MCIGFELTCVDAYAYGAVENRPTLSFCVRPAWA